ncbi:MAG TPA: dienelactone hydrolase family protein [Polaromonas sp.]|uniref:alpha/beta hydrolase n=1 Tax=Polaromonas sp. TaxID=1869339 RepID=UPI002D70530E|nr:dienelactone hydrolase family protein [Polaromonas sp.]HYW57411.1 dienelactone hydrolase family protein [Polaromonas sp.]
MLDLPLSFLHRPANAASAAPWLLVLMHGVGSNEEDLFGLAPYVPRNFHVLSLRAPYVMGPGAYGWFEFSITRSGERIIDEPQEEASRATVATTLTLAAQQLGIPADRVVVGGFSQGGIIALSLLLTQPGLLQGAMVLHSRLLAQVVPLVATNAALTGKQLWLSHGTHDQVIPLDRAHAIRELVQTLPIELRYSEYPSAHELIQQELVDAMGWLEGLTV